MNAIQILRDDHKRLKGLLRQFEAVGRRAHEMERGVLDEIFMEIEIHSTLEEQIFYPALISAISGRKAPIDPACLNAAQVDESISEHHEAYGLIRRLRGLRLDSDRFNQTFEDLQDSVEAHINREESELIPEAEQLLSRALDHLGSQMLSLRDNLIRQPRYRQARPEIVQNPHGGEQRRKRATPAA